MGKENGAKGPSLFNFGDDWQDVKRSRQKVADLQRKNDESVEEARNGHTRKIERKLEEAQSESRRAFLRLIGKGAFVLGGAALVGGVGWNLFGENEKGSNPAVAKTPAETLKLPEWVEGARKVSIRDLNGIRPVVFKSSRRIPDQMLELQEYWKRVSLDSLGRFREAHPKIPELIDFMEKNAVYPMAMGPVVTSLYSRPGDLSPMNNENAFEIVFMPEEYSKGMKGAILVEAGGRIMRVATDFRSKEWLGIMLAHEMSHIHDGIVEGENAYNEAEWLAGEVKAHRLEMALLRYLNPRTYDYLVEKGIALRKEGKRVELDQLINTLYPLDRTVLSRSEAGLGFASCYSAVLFEEALKKGTAEEALKKVYLEIQNDPRFAWPPASRSK